MARQRRLRVDDVPVHIVQRGHNRQRCFFDDGDYLRYLAVLTDALGTCRCQLHAYALMTNHVHLLLTPLDAAAFPRVLMALGRGYAHHVNRVHGRTGSLWESRYRSSLITTDSYLFACYRYIELNPVRAGIVDDPAEYRWSSYRANALGMNDPRVEPHRVYAGLGRNEADRRAAYRLLFESELEAETLDEIRRALNQCQPVGRQDFRTRTRQRQPSCPEA